MNARSQLALFFLLAATGAVSAGAADIFDIEITVTTDRSTYALGETVEILVEQCNPTDQEIFQLFSCPGCHDQIDILGSDGKEAAFCPTGGILILSPQTWAPGECKTRDFAWEQLTECSSGDPIDSGVYSVKHTFLFGPDPLMTLSPNIAIGGPPVAIPAVSATGLVVLALLVSGLALTRLSRRRPSF